MIHFECHIGQFLLVSMVSKCPLTIISVIIKPDWV